MVSNFFHNYVSLQFELKRWQSVWDRNRRDGWISRVAPRRTTGKAKLTVCPCFLCAPAGNSVGITGYWVGVLWSRSILLFVNAYIFWVVRRMNVHV